MSFLESTHQDILPDEIIQERLPTGLGGRYQHERDLSMIDLNEEISFNTPLKQETVYRGREEKHHQQTIDRESYIDTSGSTLNRDEGSIMIEGKREKMDIIAKKVNTTIRELDHVYRQIGYSEIEISEKKMEIFSIMEHTIANFTHGLQREKNNIENECEWLRQQIRIILAMVDDRNGDKNLNLMHQGIIFNNPQMFQEGFREELAHRKRVLDSRKRNFYEDSPFNVSNIDISEQDTSFEQDDTYSSAVPPKLSLLQIKNKLNSIFLHVLQIFVRKFKEFNDLRLILNDMFDIIGDMTDSERELMDIIPDRTQSEEYKFLMDEFESTLESLNLSNGNFIDGVTLLKDSKANPDTFIVSSPRKGIASINEANETPSNSNNHAAGIEKHMDYLRDLNYKLVCLIRGLKLTKITPDIIHNFQCIVQRVDKEIQIRVEEVRSIIASIFDAIEVLQLDDDSLISIQKNSDFISETNIVNGGVYLDYDTLRFIHSNPKDFGLHKAHIDFIRYFADTLGKIRETKKRKMDHYSSRCIQLWSKLNESADYIENFLKANEHLTDNSLTNFKLELNRLYVKRSEFIEKFISQTREDLEKLWAKLQYSEEEKKTFKYYSYDTMSTHDDKEVVLNCHEKELSRLEKEYQSKEVILTLYSQLQGLIKDHEFLIESSKDSSRLLSKNSCKILLNEEKIRKRLLKNMPRIISNLKSEISQFNYECTQKDEKPIALQGEDLYEKILMIETEQLDLLHNRGRKSRFKNTSVSPNKLGAADRSPKKISNTSPNTYSRKMNVKRRSISPTKTRISPHKNHNIALKPTLKPSNNRRILSNQPTIQGNFTKPSGITFSSQSDSGSNSSLESPLKTASRSNSTLSRFFGTNLPPLQSPLSSFMKQEKISSRNAYDNNDLTIHSNLSRMSPLKLNTSKNISENHDNDKKESRYRFESSNDSARNHEDKENTTTYGPEFLSPIRVSYLLPSSYHRNVIRDEKDEPRERTQIQDDRRLSSGTADSSTIIGDEYQTWRKERIRQLNSPS